MKLFGKKKESGVETLKDRFERRLAAEERRYRLNLVMIWSIPVILVMFLGAWYWQLFSTYRSHRLRVEDLEAKVEWLMQRVVVVKPNHPVFGFRDGIHDFKESGKASF